MIKQKKESICVTHSALQVGHILITPSFLPNMSKIMHLEGIGWSADHLSTQVQDPAISSQFGLRFGRRNI